MPIEHFGEEEQQIEIVEPYEADPTRAVEESVDPFEKGISEVRKVDGLSPNMRRKATRIQKAFTGEGGAKTKQLDPREGQGYGLFDVIQPEYNLGYLAKVYKISSPHFAAVNAKVANIVMLGYDWKESVKTKNTLANIEDPEKLKKARRKLERAHEELNEWLENCNAEDTFEETLRKVWTDVEATGNGYLEIGRKNNGEIGYIGHIPSKTMRVRRKRDGFVQLIAEKAWFFRNFGDRKTPDPIGGQRNPNEVIHFKKYDTDNSYYGIPDIIAAQGAVAGNEFAMRFNLDYFENKAVPRYIITTKGATLSPEAEQRLLAFFQGIRGQSHRTIYVPLPSGDKDRPVEFKMDAVEANVQDASFIKYYDLNRDTILMAHRTPITKVSLPAGIGLAAARDADKMFKEQVCRPEQRIIEKKLNRIFKEKTDIFVFALNELTLTDEDSQSKIDEREIRNKIKVPNEIRARQGLAGYEGGDEPVELKPQQAAEARAQTGATRSRDRARSAAAPDNDGEGRAAQGEGRQTA